MKIKISDERLKQIIEEELQKMINEGFFSRIRGKLNRFFTGKGKRLQGYLGKMIGFKKAGDEALEKAKQIEAAAAMLPTLRNQYKKMMLIQRELETDVRKQGYDILDLKWMGPVSTHLASATSAYEAAIEFARGEAGGLAGGQLVPTQYEPGGRNIDVAPGASSEE